MVCTSLVLFESRKNMIWFAEILSNLGVPLEKLQKRGEGCPSFQDALYATKLWSHQLMQCPCSHRFWFRPCQAKGCSDLEPGMVVLIVDHMPKSKAQSCQRW